MKFLLALLPVLVAVNGFAPASRHVATGRSLSGTTSSYPKLASVSIDRLKTFQHFSSEDDFAVGETGQTALGVVGTLSSLLVYYSEYTLQTTGSGLPAGPFGLLGLAEGLSYLAVIGLVGYSLFTKIKTGSGLPAGPAGLLGAAEGLSFLALLGGIVVAGIQALA